MSEMRNLANKIANSLDRLEQGQLDITGLQALKENSKELYERLVVMQYLLIKDENKAEKNENKTIDDIKFNFKLEPPTPPKTNEAQTNLLDVIEEVTQKVETEKLGNKENVENTEIKPSLNDQFAEKTEQMTLAEKLSKKPIASLKDAIPLNQKFLFMNNLFEGENTHYNEAITMIDKMTNIAEAEQYLKAKASQFSWNVADKSVVDFRELVQRRFM